MNLEMNKTANTIKQNMARRLLFMLDQMIEMLKYNSYDLTPKTKEGDPLSDFFVIVSPEHSSDPEPKIVTGDVEQHASGIIFESSATTSDLSDYAIIVHTR